MAARVGIKGKAHGRRGHDERLFSATSLVGVSMYPALDERTAAGVGDVAHGNGLALEGQSGGNGPKRHNDPWHGEAGVVSTCCGRCPRVRWSRRQLSRQDYIRERGRLGVNGVCHVEARARLSALPDLYNVYRCTSRVCTYGHRGRITPFSSIWACYVVPVDSEDWTPPCV